MDLVDTTTDGLKLNLKLYHAPELQLDHPHLMTEAPASLPRQGYKYWKLGLEFEAMCNSGLRIPQDAKRQAQTR